MTNINNPWDLDLHQHEATQNSTSTTGEVDRSNIIDEKKSEMKETLESEYGDTLKDYPWLSEKFKKAILYFRNDYKHPQKKLRLSRKTPPFITAPVWPIPIEERFDPNNSKKRDHSPNIIDPIDDITYLWSSLNEDEIRFINDCKYAIQMNLPNVTDVNNIDFSKLWNLMILDINNVTNLTWSNISESKNVKILRCKWVQDFEGVKLPTSLCTIRTQKWCTNLVLPEGCKHIQS